MAARRRMRRATSTPSVRAHGSEAARAETTPVPAQRVIGPGESPSTSDGPDPLDAVLAWWQDE